MIVHYLDASVWVKQYADEPGSPWVRRLLAGGRTIATATLGFVEVLSAFARKQRAGDLSSAAFEIVRAELELDMNRFIQVALNDDVFEIARVLPATYALRGADTVHLASALALRRAFVGEDDEIVVVSSDRELGDAARLARFRVIDPERPERR